jgi:hypothetical protein
MAYSYRIGFSLGQREVSRPAAVPPVAPDDVALAPLPPLLLIPGYTLELGTYHLDGTERADDSVSDGFLTVEKPEDDSE